MRELDLSGESAVIWKAYLNELLKQQQLFWKFFNQLAISYDFLQRNFFVALLRLALLNQASAYFHHVEFELVADWFEAPLDWLVKPE
jgi:hypothetical protein